MTDWQDSVVPSAVKLCLQAAIAPRHRVNRAAIEGDLLEHSQLLDGSLRADDLADPVEEFVDLHAPWQGRPA